MRVKINAFLSFFHTKLHELFLSFYIILHISGSLTASSHTIPHKARYRLLFTLLHRAFPTGVSSTG